MVKISNPNGWYIYIMVVEIETVGPIEQRTRIQLIKGYFFYSREGSEWPMRKTQWSLSLSLKVNTETFSHSEFFLEKFVWISLFFFFTLKNRTFFYLPTKPPCQTTTSLASAILPPLLHPKTTVWQPKPLCSLPHNKPHHRDNTLSISTGIRLKQPEQPSTTTSYHTNLNHRGFHINTRLEYLCCS